MSNALQLATDTDLLPVLQASLYPGAADTSVRMVLAYCRAANLDVMLKPVHIVPVYDGKIRGMRDVIMPGVGLYRTMAARSGCAGVSEPDFGPDITESIGGQNITYPSWCRVTVKRRLDSGDIAEFTAREFWKENYAVKGGQERSIAPNSMWMKRPYGQIAKCAEAQALRKAFPEVGAAPTNDEVDVETFASHGSAQSIDPSTGEITELKPLAPARKQAPVAAAEPARQARPAEKAAPAEDAVVRKPLPVVEGAEPTISEGQVKYLNGKLISLQLDDDARAQLLQRLGIPGLTSAMTLEQFGTLRAELMSMS